MNELMSRATPGKLLFGLVFFPALWFLIDGRYSSAVAMLLLPFAARAGIVVLDVFWTSFTGTPLVRARQHLRFGAGRRLDQNRLDRDRLDRDAALGGLPGLPPLPRPIREEGRRGVALFEPLPQRRLASPRYRRARRRFIGRVS